MASMLTPECGSRSQITDFYNKLSETDPNARERAHINHMAAVLLKNRQERDNYAISEGERVRIRSASRLVAKCKQNAQRECSLMAAH